MKKIFVLVLLTMFLSGCGSGLFNLSNFVLPNDEEFLAVVEELDTPEKIATYMDENFSHKQNAHYAPDPYNLWLDGEGDCNDLATFGMFVANFHGYEVWRVDIWYSDNTGHSIAVYDEGKLSYTDNTDYEYGFDNIREIVEKYYMGTLYKYYEIYDYDMNIIEQVTK